MPGLEQVEAAIVRDRLAGLLVASPNNPTGTVLKPERLAGLVEVCARNGSWFMSDEIYHGLTYDAPAATALQYSDDSIVINSFSKYFSMTGWRVGWLVVPERLVRSIEKLAQNLYIAPPAVSQVAALGAFSGIEELEANKATYAANRALLLEGLPRLGIDRIVPADGAFYLYADVSRFTDDSLAFTRRLLDETGIAATPGLDFDAERGHRFVRFSYSTATSSIAEALDRLRTWSVLK
jgi:aspartate/methionine/tyrosine aminotransferase